MNQSALTQIGDRAFSYQTCIKDVLADGRSIGNVTRYSVTTSNHQNKAGVRWCDVLVDAVPRGVDDLVDWYRRREKGP